mmetsp:Transcript_3136/g.8322  ORF Transcript_3136/g.8322 Transcript_3136/m.8322 type:complete len:383 (-) Transcript_3136:1823-2971(-)
MKIPAELQKMTIAQLKQELEALGCSTKGCRLKLQYQERLVQARKDGGGSKPAPSTPAPAKKGKAKAKSSKKEATPVEQVILRRPSLTEGLTPFDLSKMPESPSKSKKAKKGGDGKKKSSRKCMYFLLAVAALVVALLVGAALDEEPRKKFEDVIVSLAALVPGIAPFAKVLNLGHTLRAFWESKTQSGSCEPRLSEDLLTSVVFENEYWHGWSKEVIQSIEQPREEGAPPKGTAILLARNTSYSGSVYYAASTLKDQDCASCIKLFEGINEEEGVSKSKGQIQKELADFLLTCPKGIVVVENLELYGPDFLSPFHNVMSEQGGLTYDGKTIPGWHAKYLLTMNVDMAADLQSSEAAVKAAVKEKLPNAAFRRRIDYIGLGRI